MEVVVVEFAEGVEAVAEDVFGVVERSAGDVLTRDPLEALTRSAYGYAGNNPVNVTDPTGLCPFCIAFVAGALIGGGTDLAIQAGANLIRGCGAFDHLNWASIARGAAIGGALGGASSAYRSLAQRAVIARVSSTAEGAGALVKGATPVGSALKNDAWHRAGSWVVDDIATSGTVFRNVGNDGAIRTLVQMPGEVNGIAGRFEWIVDEAGNLTHQFFVKGGSVNGIPITP